MKTIIRPLSVDDANISYRWRNDPEIWKFTGRKPDYLITYEDELHWVKEVLSRANEKRFAIIADGQYVGNAQLTDINHLEAEFHIFIGEKQFWGKGIGYETALLVISYAFNDLKLKRVRAKARIENKRVIKLNEKVGFHEVHRDKEFLYMIIQEKAK